MNKKDFAALMLGLANAQAHAAGDATKARKTHKVEIPLVDLRATRARLNMSQAEFAAAYCLNARTLQGWERGARLPDETARLLVWLIDSYPADMARKIKAGIAKLALERDGAGVERRSTDMRRTARLAEKTVPRRVSPQRQAVVR
jgi:putative transcriptional regulator